MAFTHFGTLGNESAPILRKEIVANSVTIVVEDSVKLSSGFVALGTAGALVFGHTRGIQTDQGVGLNTTGAAGAAIGSFVNTYTTASDNQTVAKVRAEVDISKMTLYSAEQDAAIGTTTGSNLAGYKQDLTDEDTLDEDTAATTTCQYNIVFGTDPDDSTRNVVNIYESQVFGV